MIAAAFACLGATKDIDLSSPDGKVTVKISNAETITYSVAQDGVQILTPSAISMTLDNGSYGKGSKLVKVTRRSIDETITPLIYKKSSVRNNFNEVTLRYKDFSVVFRAYDDAVAYRFISASKTPFKVVSEQSEYAFAEDWMMYVPYTNGGIACSFENTYTHSKLSEWDATHTAFLPLMVEAEGGRKINIMEADLFGYPGMQIQNFNNDKTLDATFAAYPDKIEQGGHNMLQGMIKTRKEYIAECPAGKVFPWRILSIARSDIQMADNDIICKLAKKADPSIDYAAFTKPGKVAWDWWNDWNIYGVDFESGVNNATYKYYIDFAAKSGIEYVILDEGWAVNKQADLMQVIPEIDLEELTAYADSKGVGLILWAGYWAFNRDMENVCRHYAEMGIKGYKIDFMDRDDQPMTEFYERAAATAAKYGQMVDFHGAYKPTGLQFTYPNVINFEGVHGLEQMKWETDDLQMEYDVTIPYIRMACGPMDYTQGAMRNATKKNYRSVNTEPMSLGTRAHQLGMYVIYDSPFSMLCDAPSNYLAEPECLEYISEIPTTWDETRGLDGKVAEYITMARRKGDTWYAGGLTNWTPRDLKLDLSFLAPGTYLVTVYRDGINAHRAARDYKKENLNITVSAGMTYDIHLAPGGGFAIKFVPVK